MGNANSSKQKILNEINNSVKNSVTASADAVCKIKMGEIKMGGTNCSVKFENRCSADASASSEAIVKAAQESISKLAVEQKAGLALAINASASDQDIKNIVRTKLENSCMAGSSVMNEMEAGNVDVTSTCKNSNITFLNMGDAKSNCFMKTVVDTINKSDTSSKTSQINDLFSGLDMTMIAIIAGAVLVIIVIIKMKGKQKMNRGYQQQMYQQPMYQQQIPQASYSPRY
jgi:hypothetical protein